MIAKLLDKICEVILTAAIVGGLLLAASPLIKKAIAYGLEPSQEERAAIKKAVRHIHAVENGEPTESDIARWAKEK